MVINQYSHLIPEEWFYEYKQPETTEGRKAEIEREYFKIIRSINELPRNEPNIENDLSSLRSLYNVDAMEVYKDGDYWFNNSGVDFLYRFFPNIWDVRKKSCPLSVREGFYTDAILKRAIRKTLNYSGSVMDLIRWLRLVGLGYCVNFRPATAKALYEIFAPEDARVYDYAGGYGARCLGAYMAKNVVEYVGVDVNTETVENTHILQEYLKENYPKDTKMTTYLCGSEEFLQLHPEYLGYFDISFSSPQYFDTEIYSQEETQSCHKYSNYEKWIKFFYRPTIHNAIDVLKEGGIYSINIFEKLKNLRGELNLKEITKFIAAEKGFYCYKTDRYLLRTMPGKGAGGEVRNREVGQNFEAIWYFKSFKTLYQEGFMSEETFQKIDKKYQVSKAKLEGVTGDSIEESKA